MPHDDVFHRCNIQHAADDRFASGLGHRDSRTTESFYVHQNAVRQGQELDKLFEQEELNRDAEP
jgi:hypothetical protein